MEISWADRVRKEEVLHRVKKDGNILCTIKRRKAVWMGDFLTKNCPLKHVIEGMTEEGQRWRKDEELKDVSSYWVILRKEIIGIL
jgi:hypothetical protein